MNIRQFDRLQQLAKEAADLIIQLKFENRKLKKENLRLNEELDKRLKNVPEEITETVDKIKIENTKLKNKQEMIASRLVTMLDRVKSLNKGVEL